MKKQKQAKLFSKKNKNKSKNKENYQKNSIQVVEQKESSQKNSSKIEDILNHPILKRRLPPIEKRQNTETNEENKIENEVEKKVEDEIENNNNNFNLEEEINNNIQNLNYIEVEKEDQINDSLEIDNIIEKNKNIEEPVGNNTIDDAEKKIIINEEKKVKSEMGAGTPFFCDNIQELKNEVDDKTKIIAELSEEQNNYKFKLNELFQKLNKLLAENAELLYSEEDDEEKKIENLNELKNKLELKIKGINSSKNQNKIYKQQYDLLTNKEKISKNENIEKKIDKIKLENNELIKQIKTLKSQSRKDGKKLEDFSYNGKYVLDINKTANELKTLENKKHEYFKRLADNNKFINNCVKELENLDKFYNTQKSAKNYFNAKVEEDINRLKEDLAGNDEDIIKRIESDNAFIIKKMIHNEKMRENIFKTPAMNKPADVKKMKLKKGNSLEPLAKLKMARNNIHSGQSRRMNIVARNKSPLLTNINGNNAKKEQDDFDPTKINYNDLSDFEYKEMINKKEHCFDVVSRLEKSIKEAQKMYQRKLKEMKASFEENCQKLNDKNRENELLKSEIEDLNKILALSEQENKINIVQNTKSKKNNKNMRKTNNINNNNEKELESQKEYLSPEYYSNKDNNKSDKEKQLIPTHSNVDLTRNEILNDLKVLNSPNLEEGGPDPIFVQKNSGKISNFAMKFPDLSNIEENININFNPDNEFERNKAIDDIKKKYNIKSDYNDNNNDDGLNDDLNFDEENEEDKIMKEKERIKNEEIEERKRLEKELEDEKKFFKEHENILNGEGDEQFEPPIQNNIIEDNLMEKKEDEIDYQEKNENNQIEQEDNNNEIKNENFENNLEKNDNNIQQEENYKKEELEENEIKEEKNNANIEDIKNDDSLENVSENNKKNGNEEGEINNINKEKEKNDINKE